MNELSDRALLRDILEDLKNAELELFEDEKWLVDVQLGATTGDVRQEVVELARESCIETMHRRNKIRERLETFKKDYGYKDDTGEDKEG